MRLHTNPQKRNQNGAKDPSKPFPFSFGDAKAFFPFLPAVHTYPMETITFRKNGG